MKFEKIKHFFKVLLITIVVTRLWAISLFYIFGNNSDLTNKIVNDGFHHYQFGLLLIAIGFLLRKLFKPETVIAIGLGIFLEEWPVFLNDLGLDTNNLYHTKIDFILIFLLVMFAYFLFWSSTKKFKK